MKGSSLKSRPGSLVCPLCEVDKLKARGHSSASCASCGGIVNEATLEALRQIIALPDALGSHACECGHPEMRRLPDGVFHCSDCGSEVLPLEALGRFEMQVDTSKAGVFDGRTLGRRATEGRDQCIRKSAFGL